MQGPNKMAWAFPGGVSPSYRQMAPQAAPVQQFDPKKSSSKLETARAELSEEARLTSGIWHNLLRDESHPGIPELKWCSNLFIPFLCVDLVADPQPGHQDEEASSSNTRPAPLIAGTGVHRSPSQALARGARLDPARLDDAAIGTGVLDDFGALEGGRVEVPAICVALHCLFLDLRGL
jgi:hypothetical protein